MVIKIEILENGMGVTIRAISKIRLCAPVVNEVYIPGIELPSVIERLKEILEEKRRNGDVI